jgi:hypothetical protein
LRATAASGTAISHPKRSGVAQIIRRPTAQTIEGGTQMTHDDDMELIHGGGADSDEAARL